MIRVMRALPLAQVAPQSIDRNKNETGPTWAPLVAVLLVELEGFEPSTSTLPVLRSPD